MYLLSFLKKSSKTVYFLQYHVLPVDKTFEKSGGAYVNCWICFKAADYICDLTTFYIEKAGWKIKKQLTHPKIVTGNDFIQDNFFLNCYKESLKIGYSLSFYPWLAGQMEPSDINAFIQERNKIREKTIAFDR